MRVYLYLYVDIAFSFYLIFFFLYIYIPKILQVLQNILTQRMKSPCCLKAHSVQAAEFQQQFPRNINIALFPIKRSESCLAYFRGFKHGYIFSIINKVS